VTLFFTGRQHAGKPLDLASAGRVDAPMGESLMDRKMIRFDGFAQPLKLLASQKI
jgi:hypothetical protein